MAPTTFSICFFKMGTWFEFWTLKFKAGLTYCLVFKGHPVLLFYIHCNASICGYSMLVAASAPAARAHLDALTYHVSALENVLWYHEHLFLTLVGPALLSLLSSKFKTTLSNLRSSNSYILFRYRIPSAPKCLWRVFLVASWLRTLHVSYLQAEIPFSVF